VSHLLAEAPQLVVAPLELGAQPVELLVPPVLGVADGLQLLLSFADEGLGRLNLVAEALELAVRLVAR